MSRESGVNRSASTATVILPRSPKKNSKNAQSTEPIALIAAPRYCYATHAIHVFVLVTALVLVCVLVVVLGRSCQKRPEAAFRSPSKCQNSDYFSTAFS